MIQGHFRAQEGPLGPSRKSQQQTKRTGFAALEDAFDASPAWEDITAQVAINRVYNFLNESKTAEKWGVNVRFTITKNEGYEEEVSISGFGGAYE